MKNKSISKRLLVATPTMIVCAVLALGSAAFAQSAAPDTNGRCSNRTLSGDYGFALTGEILGPGFQLRGVVMQHYDGNGHITQVDHVIDNGAPPAQEWTPGSGTYSVNPDCTGSAVITSQSNPFPLVIHFVVVNQGKQINQVVDANAVTAVGNRVN